MPTDLQRIELAFPAEAMLHVIDHGAVHGTPRGEVPKVSRVRADVIPSSPELAILRFLAAHAHSSAAEIGIACRMTAAEVRARLVMLESMRLVAGRQYAGTVPPRRAYVLTGEGRRKAGIVDARSTT